MKAPASPVAARPSAQPFTVTIETISYINDMVSEPGSPQKDHPESAQIGDTVRTVLRRFADRHPKLKDALWDRGTGGLGEHVEVIVNDALLGVKHELDSPVQPNDRIVLLGQYIGG